MNLRCQDCNHHFLLTPSGVVGGGACPNCGGKRMERDQPSPLHSDGELRNMVDPDTGMDMGGNPLMEGIWGSIDNGWKPFGKRDESFASVQKHAAGDADHFVQCDQGHTHWGGAGAAGLMLNHVGPDGQTRYLLQHRSPFVDHPDTWSTPGGALSHGETPAAGAVRETEEEFGALPHHVITHVDSDDHGNWAYHTVHGTVTDQFTPTHADGEGQDHGWFTPDEIDQLPLHPGFAGSWRAKRHMYSKIAGQPIGTMICPQCEGSTEFQGLPCPACEGHGYVFADRGADGPYFNMHDQNPLGNDIVMRGPGEPGEPSDLHHIPYSIDPKSLQGRLPLQRNYGSAMERTLNMDPYPSLWSDEFETRMEHEAAMALPAALPALGAAARFILPKLMRGALMGVGSNAIGGLLGGDDQMQQPQIAPPRPDTVFSHTAGESDISSGDLSNPGYYQHDNAADADQHQFADESTDTNFANPNADAGGGEGGVTTDNIGNPGDEKAGIGADKPSFTENSPGVQRANMILPLLLDYHNREESGANDPMIRELHELLEKEVPGYLNDVGAEHQHAFEWWQNQAKEPSAIQAKTADAFAPGMGMIPNAPGMAPAMQPGGGLPGVGAQGRCPYCGGTQMADGSCPQCGAKSPPGGQQAAPQQVSTPPMAPPGVAPAQTVPGHFGADNIAKRCPYCGSGTTGIHDDWSGSSHCHACGQVWDEDGAQRARWGKTTVVAADDVQPMGDQAPPVGVPAADQTQPEDPAQEQDSSLTWQDDSGQQLIPGQQYEMHSAQYAVPDIVRVETPKPDELVFTTIGEQSPAADPNDPNGGVELGRQHRLTKQDADMYGVTFVPVNGNDSNAGEQSLDQYADSGQAPVNTQPQPGIGTHSHVTAGDNQGPTTPEQISAVQKLLVDQGRVGEVHNVPLEPYNYVREMAEVANRVNVGPQLPPGQAPTPPPMDPAMMGGGMPPGGAPPMDPGMMAQSSVEDDGLCKNCQSEHVTSAMIDPNNLESECYRCGHVWVSPVESVESDARMASRAWLNEDPTDDFAMNMERIAAMKMAESSGSRSLSDIAAKDARLQAIKQRLNSNPSLFKEGGANFNSREQREFVEEQGSARNSDLLDLEDTHYRLKDEWETKGNASNAPDDHMFLGLI
jgi:8-oxo-dGTP diphosphatase